ncbi:MULTISPECIES: ParD-like family protein [unclassified Pseudomonas]|uniref:ParD-like family protein n=1 Tax=unclassified Pseudomonas TaxID=196821 RepID=UPI0025E4F4EE|nr:MULTISPECIES: ParD-like family protein [unclassified Pseudomonas]
MGLVKISEQMHANIRSASAALSRSINAQAEHWMRVGMLAELNPGLNYSDICQLLIRAEAEEETRSSAQLADSAGREHHARAV